MRLFFILFCISFSVYAQQTTTITGSILKEGVDTNLDRILVSIEGSNEITLPNTLGEFQFITSLTGAHILKVSTPYYSVKRIPILLEGQNLDLGIITLKNDITIEQTDNLITLTESDLSDDDETVSLSAGILQATRDVFLNRAAFDFGQAFFRVRGYDSKNGQVLINGIRMNKFFDGRPQWNNWGGLNDIIRNQDFTNGLKTSAYTFGGILGNTNTASNRTYSGRLMTTYTSRQDNNGLSYTFSASRRWAKQGYIDGTLYDAYSFYGALEYELNDKNSLMLTGILAKNRRGRSAAITEEVFELVGNQYNPYWGDQNGDIRNSRERNISEPILLLNHYYESNKLKITSSLSYQFGTNARSRLGYFNAPNPEPTYYRYLPSFYINNTIGADFTNAALAREGFLANPQMNWANLYQANSNGKAAYVYYNDKVDAKQISLSTAANFNLNSNFTFDFGVYIWRNF